MKQPTSDTSTKPWLPLAVLALFCNAAVGYLYVTQNDKGHATASVDSNQAINNDTNLIEPISTPSTPSTSTDANNAQPVQNKNLSNKPIAAIIVKKTTHTNIDTPNSEQNSSEQAKANTANPASKDSPANNTTADKENANKAGLKAKDTDEEHTNVVKDASQSAKKLSDSNRNEDFQTKTTNKTTKDKAKANQRTATDSKNKQKQANNQPTPNPIDTDTDWQAQYESINQAPPSPPARTAEPIRRGATEQEIKDASLLSIDLPASEQPNISSNNPATSQLQEQTNTVKSNTEALQNQLSDTIQSIKDINQQKIERDKQLAQRAYVDQQHINQLKQQQEISRQIDNTETELEQATLPAESSPE